MLWSCVPLVRRLQILKCMYLLAAARGSTPVPKQLQHVRRLAAVPHSWSCLEPCGHGLKSHIYVDTCNTCTCGCLPM